jgi:hypothetical protein
VLLGLLSFRDVDGDTGKPDRLTSCVIAASLREDPTDLPVSSRP